MFRVWGFGFRVELVGVGSKAYVFTVKALVGRVQGLLRESLASAEA